MYQTLVYESVIIHYYLYKKLRGWKINIKLIKDVNVKIRIFKFVLENIRKYFYDFKVKGRISKIENRASII